MPRRKPIPNAGSHLRREIAGVAARMMAEDGIADYGFAKRKAAKSLGGGDGVSLPTNEEVEAELRTYQAIYQDEEQPERLQELRRAALEVMGLLADFRPYLTGAVLDGTAGRYSGIEIDLYADSAKDVEIMLLSHNIAYDPDDNIRNRPDAPEAQLRLDWAGIPVLLSVYPFVAERRQLRNPHTGRSSQRARADAVAALLK
ncbi:MAG: hypothetical protein A2045_06650 [Rhodocyclales bacterium GWA2_65_20]|nr:MAG: hypothetical protein A2045_06650 [Rhodocyclales bacterium GWA2_65_20]